MKFTGLVRASVLISLLGTTALIYAQDPKPQDESRPEATRPPRDEAKPPAQDEAKPPRQDEAKPAKPEDVKPAARQDDAKPPKQAEHTDQPSEHAAQRADNKRSGSRIPDDKFRANFGRQHTLVINRTTIVEGQPRFQYSGYWFALVDPWPVGWAYSDQCYIDYIDGEYFLFDLPHPGVRIAIDVVL